MEPTAATPGTATGPAAAAETTEHVSAQRAAADKGDVTAFLDADRAQRSGKPPARVERPVTAPETRDQRGAPGRQAAAPVTGKGGAPAPGPRAADREADERLTSRIREAVDTATASSRAHIAELERRLAGNQQQGAPAGEQRQAAEAPYKRYLAMPDAPKVEDFDSILEHNAAVSHFIAGKMHAERLDVERSAGSVLERSRAELERVKVFHGRIQAHKAADPTFTPAQLSPEVRGLHGFSKLAEINERRASTGERPLPATVDHAIAEAMYDSETPAQVALFLSQHPEEFAALRACTSPRALDRAFVRLEGKIAGAAGTTATAAPAAAPPQQKAAAKADADAVVDRSVSRFTPPASTLGKAGSAVDPMRQAIEKGDVGMFLELDRQARIERRSRNHV